MAVPRHRAVRCAVTVRIRSRATSRLIQAEDWGWRHAGREAWAIRHLDLRIDEGERVLLLGASGAGKSTLLLALAGLLDPTGGGESEGTLTVGGRTPHDARDETAIVFQDPETQLVMPRSGDDVAFGLENRCVPSERIWPQVHAALAAVAFPYPGDRRTDALSGGEKQRLALAGVLALGPRLLLLDEPTANLDPSAKKEIEAMLAGFAHEGMTLVMSTHNLGQAKRLATRVVYLDQGIIRADLPTERFFGEHIDARAELFLKGELKWDTE